MAGDQQQENVGKLEKLARVRFPKLTKSELELIRSAPREGAVAFCGPSTRDDDPQNDSSQADAWGREREISADVIRWILADRRATDCVDPQGLRIHGAKIVGQLYLSHIAVPFPLCIWHCALIEDAHLRGMEIAALDLTGSRVGDLDLQGARVKGDVFLRDRFCARGEVKLLAAQIGGDLDCSGGRFVNPPTKESPESGAAITADGITVTGQVLLSSFSSATSNRRSTFHAEGEVRFLQAQISMNFDCSSGVFLNPALQDVPASGRALSADGISVKGQVLLSKRAGSLGFYAEGEVRLPDAQIGGSLNCDGGTFINPQKAGGGGNALWVERAIIRGDLCFKSDDASHPVSFRGKVLTGQFRADGAISLAGTRIDGNLDLRRSLLEKAQLILERTSTTSFMYGTAHWPTQGNLFLDGFVYGRVADGPRDPEVMLKWLRLQPQGAFRPQPYLQLAKVLRESGDEDGERQVLVAMEDHRWRFNHPSLYPLGLPLKLTAGYGYRPLWAFWEILGLSALGWIIYRRSYLAGNMVPTDKDAYALFKQDGRPPAHYITFHPLVYSVENSLPLVKLGQADKWQPDPNRGPSQQATLPVPESPNVQRKGLFPWGWFNYFLVFLGLQNNAREQRRSRLSRLATSAKFLRWFLWFQILLGWLLATLFLAGVTGLIRKQ